MARFIAFYSYKGGVGRSLALANVAWALMERGKRVVMLDMDLEAPGLHSLEELPLPKKRKRGMVEYAAHYVDHGHCPPIKKHILECDTGAGLGKLWLMSAGRGDESYQRDLAGLDWRCLHKRHGNERFVNDLKSAIEKHCRPDYVLIDARTGFSDVGGFSTHMLADMAVLIFNLTEACISGTVRAYEAMVQAGSIDHFVLVASPVPNSNRSLVEKRIDQAITSMSGGRRYGQKAVSIHYDANLVLNSPLAVRNVNRYAAAANSYSQLVRYLQWANVEDGVRAYEEALRLRDDGKSAEAVTRMQAFVADHSKDADARRKLGELALQCGRPEDAAVALEELQRLTHDWDDWAAGEVLLVEAWLAAGQPGRVVARLGEVEKPTSAQANALKRAYEALGKTQEAMTAQRAELAAAVPLATTGATTGFKLAPLQAGLRPLQGLVDQKEETIAALQLAAPSPDFDAGTLWWAVMGSLFLDTGTKRWVLEGGCGRKLDASQLSGIMRALEEETVQGVEWWGNATLEAQRRLAVSGADVTVAASLQHLVETEAPAASDGVLASLAATTAEPHQRLTYAQLAAQALPHSAQCQVALGNTLAGLAREAEGEERRTLLEQALEKAAAANTIKAHFADYNRACCLSRLERFDEAEKALRDELQRRPHMLSHALSDPDFAPLWSAKPTLREALSSAAPSTSPPKE